MASILCCAVLLALLPSAAKAADSGKWDGTTIDVSWYSSSKIELYIGTPAQLAGLAAIVNGIYNKSISNVIGDSSCIVDRADGSEQVSGSQNKSTGTYHYGADNFSGKTVYLTADLDMGGVYDSITKTWSGPNYMPIGGQYLMEQDDSSTKLGSSFCGTLDGQGHTVYNLYCSRRCTNGNYGDGQSVGLVGRLGVHDNDPVTLRPVDPTVRNLAVTGYIYANRSVGGIVGKIGKTSYNNDDGSTGGIIENCANFAAVSNTDAKGCGGICGAAWNGGVIRNCYNAGNISSTYVCPTGGIAGSNEITLENCYNVGTISVVRDEYAMAIGTNNGGGVNVDDCYWLSGSAPGGGYYGKTKGVVTELTAAGMQKAGFVLKLGDAFSSDTGHINGGYPILTWQSTSRAWGDITTGSWCASAVEFVTKQGLFGGTAPAVFSPDVPMTRLMLAAALYRLAGSPTVTAASPFTDCDDSAVIWAQQVGVVNGKTAALFDPSGSINRQQITAMFYRYAENVAKENVGARGDLTVFRDAGSVSDFARDSMGWAVGTGIMTGTSTTALSPSGTATRAQVAVMMQRLNSYLM